MLISSVILSQMLPSPTLVKGGIGVKLRLGETGTRATTDFDVATSLDQTAFQGQLDARLEQGWGLVPPSKVALRRNPAAESKVAFTGSSRLVKQARPDGVPSAYLMTPYGVSLQFLGSAWGGVTLEVGHDELDGELDASAMMATELTDLTAELGFGEVQPVPLITVERQLAQKIHAVTLPGSERAHDLVDIQLLWDEAVDDAQLSSLCQRTFDYRRSHAWPPDALVAAEDLRPIYDGAVSQTVDENGEPSVIVDYADATAWFNRRVNGLCNRDADKRTPGSRRRQWSAGIGQQSFTNTSGGRHNMFELVAATVAQAAATGAAESVGGYATRRGAGRGEVADAYMRLHEGVLRVQMRSTHILTVHTASLNPLHVAAMATGFQLNVDGLHQLIDDFADVSYRWQRVRLLGSPTASRTADALVLAVCEVVRHVDPGWHRPRARKANRRDLDAAKEVLAAAILSFELTIRAECATRRADRREARRQLEAHEGDSVPGGPTADNSSRTLPVGDKGVCCTDTRGGVVTYPVGQTPMWARPGGCGPRHRGR